MGKLEDQVVNRALYGKPLRIVCKKCGSEDITKITYGLPGWIIVDEPIDPRIEALVKDRRIVLGGCIEREGSPKYFCRACNYKFGK